MKKRLLATLCIFIFVFAFVFSFSAFAVPSQTLQNVLPDESIVVTGSKTVNIRVGIYPFSGFTDINENSLPSGYAIEYLNEIATYTDWTYSYVNFADWDSCYLALQSGEIDIICGTVKTPAREEIVDFSSQAMATSYLCLYVSTDNTAYAYADYKNFNGITIGVTKNDSRFAPLQKHAYEMGFACKYIFYDTEQQVIDAMHEGKVDAFLGDRLYYAQNERSVDDFGVMSLYFMTNPSKIWLTQSLNTAMEKIIISNPTYNTDLFSKYYPVQANLLPVYTSAEKKFIATNNSLAVYYNSNLAPVSYIDSNGKAAGIAPDIFKKICEYTGVNFTYYSVDLSHDYTVANSSASYGIVSSIYNNTELLTAFNLKASNTYIKLPVVLVGRSSDSIDWQSQGTVAVLNSDISMQYFLKENFSNLKQVYVNTVDECFEAVENGRTDFCIEYSYVVNDYLQRQNNQILSIISSSFDFMPMSIGLTNNAPDELLTLLNKGISAISAQERDNIILQNTISSPFKTTIYTFLRRHILLLSFAVLAFMGLIIWYIAWSRRQVSKIAYVDPLTGYDTYAKFSHKVLNILEKNPEPSAIVALDICNFKFINDTLGRVEGDNMLIQLANELKASLKKNEFMARDYADNFILYVRYPSQKLCVRRFNNFENNLHLTHTNGRALNTPALCAGIYPIAKGETDLYQMVSNASLAKKSAKNPHKSTLGFYSKKLHDEILETKQLETSFLTALNNNEFLIYLQPKFSLLTKKIVGAEALVRWNHPTLGMLSPNKFISLCERNGFIVDLDFYVFKQAFKLINTLKKCNLQPVPLSVNVSRAHLQDKNFVEKFAMLVNQYRIPHHLVECELTENLFFENISLLIDFVQELKDNGFVVSIDDFGSGYSSLNMLKDVPIDILKLDREFFAEGESSERERVIIQNVIRMAKDLDMTIICEGVETSEQVEFLTALNCDYAQGYFFARPLPVNDFISLLKAEQNKL